MYETQNGYVFIPCPPVNSGVFIPPDNKPPNRTDGRWVRQDTLRAFLACHVNGVVDSTQLWTLFLCTSINPVLNTYLQQIGPHCV